MSIPLNLKYRLNIVSCGRSGSTILYHCVLYEAKKLAKGKKWTYRPVRTVSKAYSDGTKAMNEGKLNCPGIKEENIRFGSFAWEPVDNSCQLG